MNERQRRVINDRIERERANISQIAGSLGRTIDGVQRVILAGRTPNSLGELQGSATMFDAACARLAVLVEVRNDMEALA